MQSAIYYDVKGMVEMMSVRNYQVYVIDNRVVGPYIGKENKFFGLFYDFLHSKGTQRRIIGRQILYITKPIPVQSVCSLLETHPNITLLNGVYYVRSKGKSATIRSTAQLQIHNHVLRISSEGGYDAETILFECIRKIDAHFLAVDLENHRYGWLKPIKERKFI